MKLKRILFNSALLSVLTTVLLVGAVLAQTWAFLFPINVLDTGGTTRTFVPVLTGATGQGFVDTGYITPSGTDTNMEINGVSVPYMLSTTQIATVATNLAAGGHLVFDFKTGYAPVQTEFPIVVGTGGYITTLDNADLELGNYFESEIDAYIDTSASTIDYANVAAINGGNDVVNQLNHTVNMPAGVVAGDLLIVLFATDQVPVVAFPGGWTLLSDDAVGGDIRFVVYYRIADGTEGASIIVTTADIQMTAHTSYRIEDYIGIPEIGVTATGLASGVPNPPNLAPSWGAKNTLWLAVAGYGQGALTVNAYPANYTDGREDRSNDGQGVGVGSARRELNAAAENPGIFTLSGVADWAANTIAIQVVQKSLIYKHGAFETLVSAANTITSRVITGTFPEVTATGVTSGEHVVTTTGDGVNGLQIYIDGTLEDATPLPAAGGNIWVQVAPQSGVETAIWSMASYNDKVYGGTEPNGQLLEWNGVNAWVLKAPKLGAESVIYSLAVYNGKLYGGTSPNGKLYEWDDAALWVEVAPRLGAETKIQSLAVYNGKLYGGTSPNGKLYEWDGAALWVEVAPQLNAQISVNALAVHNGRLFGGTDGGGRLFRWNDVDAWEEVAPTLNAQTHIYGLAVCDGKLYGGTRNGGRLFEWDDVNTWVEVAPQLGAEIRIYSLETYNGKVYGGTGNLGKLYEWNGINAWVEVAPQLGAETRIYELQVNLVQLYGGTNANGLLYEWNEVISGVPDNANDWVWNQNDVMPYIDSITQDVDDVRQLWYRPTGMIDAAVLLESPSYEVPNRGFEYGDPPDDWTLFGAGATLVRSDAQAHSGTYSALMTRNGTDAQLYYLNPNFLDYAGETLTLEMWVYATVAARARITIFDGVGTSNSAFHTGAAGWELLSITHTVDAAPTFLRVIGRINTGDTSAYFDDVVFSIGDSVNSGTITWGANVNMTISFGEVESYEATSAAIAEVEIGYNIPAAGMPEGWFGGGDITTLPFYDNFNDISGDTGIPVNTLYMIPVIAVAMAVSFGVFMVFKPTFIAFGICGVIVYAGFEMNIVPAWLLFTYGVVGVAIIYGRRQL